jgi:hypothetical protein
VHVVLGILVDLPPSSPNCRRHMILITLQRVSNLSNPPAACNNLLETNLKKKLSFLLDSSPVIVAE